MDAEAKNTGRSFEWQIHFRCDATLIKTTLTGSCQRTRANFGMTF